MGAFGTPSASNASGSVRGKARRVGEVDRRGGHTRPEAARERPAALGVRPPVEGAVARGGPSRTGDRLRAEDDGERAGPPGAGAGVLARRPRGGAAGDGGGIEEAQRPAGGAGSSGRARRRGVAGRPQVDGELERGVRDVVRGPQSRGGGDGDRRPCRLRAAGQAEPVAGLERDGGALEQPGHLGGGRRGRGEVEAVVGPQAGVRRRMAGVAGARAGDVDLRRGGPPLVEGARGVEDGAGHATADHASQRRAGGARQGGLGELERRGVGGHRASTMTAGGHRSSRARAPCTT
jgi:hypothetical protein